MFGVEEHVILSLALRFSPKNRVIRESDDYVTFV